MTTETDAPGLGFVVATQTVGRELGLESLLELTEAHTVPYSVGEK
jgi:hypothetical protein